MIQNAYKMRIVLRRIQDIVPVLRRRISTTKSSASSDVNLWTYRGPHQKPPSKTIMIQAQTVGAIMWWWIFWHLWKQPEHVFGEHPRPDPLLWTDEELGIPPDDDD